MNRSWAILFAIVLAAIGLVGFAFSTADARGPQDARDVLVKKIGELMPLLAQGKVDTLLQAVGMTSDPNREEYDAIRNHIAGLTDAGGKYMDFEIVGYKSLGAKYQSVYVMAYYQKMPVMFEFGFYNAGDVWQPLRLRVETNFQTLLDTLPMEKP